MANYSTLLIDKLKSKPASFTNSITEGVYVNLTVGVSYTIDLANGTLQKLMMTTANTTFVFPTISNGLQFTLILEKNISTVINWPIAVKWPNSTPPTLSSSLSRVDIFSFISVDTVWYGILSGQNY